MKQGNLKFELPTIEESFMPSCTTETVKKIPIDKISEFKNHPFKVKDDDEMKKMVESVKKYGILNPILVRPKGNGGFEMISGHRRKRASEIARITEILAIVYELGSWTFLGGKQEYDETIFEGAIREVKEETNLDISNLEIFNATDDIQPNKHYITIQIIANKCEGELKNLEPTKHSEWKWFDLNNLPENLYTPTKKFIEKYLEKCD